MPDDITASVSGALPKGEANGLLPYAQDMADHPRKIRVALILFDCPKTTYKHDDETALVTARIRRLEVLSDSADAAVVQRILMREYERRTGQTTLPFELETDIKTAFDAVDFNEVSDLHLKENEEAEAALEEWERDKKPADEPDDSTRPDKPGNPFLRNADDNWLDGEQG
jgi:hypothetical protein